MKNTKVKNNSTRKELLLEQVDRLRKLRLPSEWEVAKLNVEFTRKGMSEEWGQVVYDSMNNTFYVKTNKSICYPQEVKVLLEGMEIMKKANEIIESKYPNK